MRPDDSVNTFTASADPQGVVQWKAEAGVRDSLLATATGWDYKVFADDAVERYDTAGRLLSITERNGWVTTLSYSDATTPVDVAPRPGLLIRVTNHFGRALTFGYEPSGRLATLIDPAGGAVRYGYDGFGNLASVTWQDNTTRTYRHEDSRFPGHVTGITDEAGVRYSTYAYDDQGRVASSELAGGAERLSFSYISLANTTVYSGGTGRSYSFRNSAGVLRPTNVSAPCSGCGSTARITTYDASNNKTKEVAHDGRVSFYAYDAQGRETERATFPSSYQSATTRPPLSAATRVTSTQWHATWKLPLQVAEPGKLSSYSYDARGNLTGQSWTATTDATGAQGFGATATGATYATGWAYDGNSLPVSIVEQTGTTETGRWTLAYNGSGDVTSVTDVIRGNLVGRATQYDAHGRMLAGTTDAGVALGFTYAPRGFYATKRVSGQTVTFTQNPIGLTTEVRMPDSQVLGYVYDAAHRLTDIRLNGASITPAMLASAEYPDTFAKATFERTRVLLQGAIEALLPSAFAQVPMPPGGLRPVLILPGQPMPGQPEFDPRTDLMTMAPMLPVDRAQRAIAEALQRCVSCNPNGGYERPWLTPGSYAHLMTGGHLFPMFGNQSYFTIPVGQSLVDTVVAAGQPTTEKGKLVYRVVLPGYVGRIPWPFGSGTFAETKKITLVVEKENCPPGQYARNEVVTMHPGWRRIDGP